MQTQMHTPHLRHLVGYCVCIVCVCVVCIYIYISSEGIYADTNAHTATHCNTLQHKLYNALQRTATHCDIHVWIYADTNALTIYLARIYRDLWRICVWIYADTNAHTATHCNTHSATQCNALQRTVTHCNIHVWIYADTNAHTIYLGRIYRDLWRIHVWI